MYGRGAGGGGCGRWGSGARRYLDARRDALRSAAYAMQEGTLRVTRARICNTNSSHTLPTLHSRGTFFKERAPRRLRANSSPASGNGGEERGRASVGERGQDF